MTTTELANHPNTNTIKHMLLGAVAAMLMQHGADAQQHVAWLANLLNSDEVKAAVVAVIGLFSALQSGIKQPQQLGEPIKLAPAQFDSSAIEEAVVRAIKGIAAAQQQPATVAKQALKA